MLVPDKQYASQHDKQYSQNIHNKKLAMCDKDTNVPAQDWLEIAKAIKGHNLKLNA